MKGFIAPLSGVLLVLLHLSVPTASAQAQRKGASATIQHGVVVGVQRTQLQSEAARGALVGGGLGLASASGKSRSKKWRNSVIGAAAGAGMTRAAEGSLEGMMYSVEVGEGKIVKVVTDQTEIRQGDCVVVEQAGGRTNLRRVSQATCEPASQAVVESPAVQEELVEEAAECAAAKDEVLAAESDEEIRLAVQKMKIFCDD